MSIFNIILYIIAGGLAVLFVLFFAAMSNYLFWFYFRRCKECNHIMYYRGYRERDEGSFHYFHCKHCGNWEKISRLEFLRELGLEHNNE